MCPPGVDFLRSGDALPPSVHPRRPSQLDNRPAARRAPSVTFLPEAIRHSSDTHARPLADSAQIIHNPVVFMPLSRFGRRLRTDEKASLSFKSSVSRPETGSVGKRVVCGQNLVSASQPVAMTSLLPARASAITVSAKLQAVPWAAILLLACMTFDLVEHATKTGKEFPRVDRRTGTFLARQMSRS